MFHQLDNVLSPQEVANLKAISESAPFVDGRISNPHNTAKNNLQVDMQHSAYRDSAKVLMQALWRCEDFRNYAFPRRVLPPLLCRYRPGMKYGAHSDSPYIPVQPEPVRSDVSVTIFLNDPSTYEGGELVIHLGGRAIPFKCAPGSAIAYPSTTIHEVAPVTKGERLVAITFVESQIGDERHRELLYTLNEVAALEGLNMQWENRTRLEHVRNSLHRIWSS